MQIDLTPETISNWIGEILRVTPRLVGNEIEFNFNSRHERQLSLELDPNNTTPSLNRKISVERLHAILDTLRKKEEYQDSGIFDKNSYEVLVTEETPFPIRRFRGDNFSLQDSENEITYSLSTPSDEYMIFLLYKVSQIANPRLLSNFPSRMGRLIEDTEMSVLDIVKSLSPRFMTLQITSTKPTNISSFAKYANSFFFHLSYNLDTAIVPQRYFDELVRMGRIGRVRRSRLEDLTPPSRFYSPDLVHYYQEGVASDSPPLQYLSFYHVAEHFFESIYNDELIERVKK